MVDKNGVALVVGDVILGPGTFPSPVGSSNNVKQVIYADLSGTETDANAGTVTCGQNGVMKGKTITNNCTFVSH